MLVEIVYSELWTEEHIWTIVLAAIAFLGGPRLWTLIMEKVKQKNRSKSDMIKYHNEVNKKYEGYLNKTLDELKDEVESLKEKLKTSEDEKDDIMLEMADLKVRIAVLTERLTNYALHSRGKKIPPK